MKNLTLFLASFLLLVSACKKEKSTSSNNNNNNNNPTSPYYFKFTLNGASYNFNANIPQYMPFYANEIGGYEVANGNLFPSAGLRLSWHTGDTVKESDVTGLVGKTLYFSDTNIHPEISYDEANLSINTWYSIDTANTSYNVKITNVTFLKKDTSAGHPLRTYVITGTCNAVISNSDSTAVFSAGSFNFIISRMDL